MQPQHPSRTKLHAGKAAALLALLGISACAAPPPPAAPQAKLPADPVLAYVATGPIGQTGVVNAPAQGGNVVVVIGTQYNSAAGEVCRTYATTTSSEQSQHLACGTGANWHVVPPLVSSSN